MKRTAVLLACLLGLPALPALAGNPSYGGWGARVGVADDPDQAVFGAHWVLEDLVPNLRFMPNIELGLGDDHTIVAVTAPVHYMFRDLDAPFTPYAGGGVTLAFIDEDRGRKNDDDFEIALRITGGLEWRLGQRRDFFVELNLIGGDVHDLQVIAGWTFRAAP